MTLSEQIKSERGRRELNQHRASVEIGISVQLLRNIEQGGTASPATLEKINKWMEAEKRRHTS
jgi:transcriptional regulator with XRE-family HTH domain